MAYGRSSVFMRSKALVVAAIEFGTSYSGYGLAFSDDYIRDPMRVSFPIFRDSEVAKTKASTVVLLNPDESFNSFGEEAEDRYNALLENDEHHDYHYFTNFKRILYEPSSLNLDMMLEGSNGHKVKASTVFAMSIKYFKDHLMGKTKASVTNIHDDDVYWVLTVPANDCSKQFMKKAAEMAGISSSMDIIVESEAVSSYYMHEWKDKMKVLTTGSMADIFTKGSKYAIVNFEHDEVSSSAYEVKDSTTLQELDYAIDTEIGGKLVDVAFEKFLISIFGDCFVKFKQQCPYFYIEMHRKFEIKKRTLKMHKSSRESVFVPATLIEMYEEEMKKKGTAISLSKRITQIKELNGKVGLHSDKLRVDVDIVKSWFDEVCSKSVEHVKKLLQCRKCKEVNTILLAGEFSDSLMLQEAVKSAFSDKRVIISRGADVAVLKGAVMYGHNPLTVLSLLSPHSYLFK